jgi:hypothetical protein
MPLNVERCRSELDQLELELDGWSQANPPGLELWTHKLYARIGEIVGPKHALAIRLSGVRWDAANRAKRQLSGQYGPHLVFNPPDAVGLAGTKETTKGIIAALRWEILTRSPNLSTSPSFPSLRNTAMPLYRG